MFFQPMQRPYKIHMVVGLCGAVAQKHMKRIQVSFSLFWSFQKPRNVNHLGAFIMFVPDSFGEKGNSSGSGVKNIELASIARSTLFKRGRNQRRFCLRTKRKSAQFFHTVVLNAPHAFSFQAAKGWGLMQMKNVVTTPKLNPTGNSLATASI